MEKIKLDNKFKIHIILFIVYILYAVCSLFFFVIFLLVGSNSNYNIIILSLFPIFYILFYILNKRKYYFIIFILSIISLIILFIYLDSTYVERIYYEDYISSIKDDYLFGLLKKYETITEIVFFCTIISYPIIIVINIILFIKKIIEDKKQILLRLTRLQKK